jgi:hypothetical protein
MQRIVFTGSEKLSPKVEVSNMGVSLNIPGLGAIPVASLMDVKPGRKTFLIAVNVDGKKNYVPLSILKLVYDDGEVRKFVFTAPKGVLNPHNELVLDLVLGCRRGSWTIFDRMDPEDMPLALPAPEQKAEWAIADVISADPKDLGRVLVSSKGEMVRLRELFGEELCHVPNGLNELRLRSNLDSRDELVIQRRKFKPNEQRGYPECYGFWLERFYGKNRATIKVASGDRYEPGAVQVRFLGGASNFTAWHVTPAGALDKWSEGGPRNREQRQPQQPARPAQTVKPPVEDTPAAEAPKPKRAPRKPRAKTADKE